MPPVSEETGGRIVQLFLRYGFFIALPLVVLGFARSALDEDQPEIAFAIVVLGIGLVAYLAYVWRGDTTPSAEFEVAPIVEVLTQQLEASEEREQAQREASEEREQALRDHIVELTKEHLSRDERRSHEPDVSAANIYRDTYQEYKKAVDAVTSMYT